MIGECRDELLAGKTHHDKDRSPTTVSHYLAAFSHVLSVAVKEWEWLETSPMGRVTKPKLPRGRCRALDAEERTRLLNACKDSPCPILYDLVIVALSTGMRYNEIRLVDWDHVDLNRGLIS